MYYILHVFNMLIYNLYNISYIILIYYINMTQINILYEYDVYNILFYVILI